LDETSVALSEAADGSVADLLPLSRAESEADNDVYVPDSVLDEDSVKIPVIPNLQKFVKDTVRADVSRSATGLLRVASVNKTGGRRIWDKVMACCFCPALLKNKISEHLTIIIIIILFARNIQTI